MTEYFSTIPEVSSGTLELLNTEEMIEVDRLMTDVLKIELIQMMENAGRNLARLCIGRFLQDPQSKHVLVCLLYTSPSPRDATLSRMPSSA